MLMWIIILLFVLGNHILEVIRQRILGMFVFKVLLVRLWIRHL